MDFWVSVLHLALVVLNLFFAFSIYKNEKHSLYSKAFVFYALFQAIWIFTMFLGYEFASINYSLAFWSFRVAYGSSLMMAVSFLVFAYDFPVQQFKVSNFVRNLFSVFNFLWAFLFIFTDIILKEMVFDEAGVYVSDILGPLFFMYLLLVVLYLFMGFIFLIRKLFILKGVAKTKVLIVLWGSVFSGISIVFINIVLPFFFGIYNVKFTVGTSLFLMLSTFYAISKFRFLNISNYAFNFLRRFLLFMIFVILTLSFSYIFKYILSVFGGYEEIYLLLMAGIVYLSMAYLKSIIPILENKDVKFFNARINYLYLKLPYIEDFSRLVDLLEKVFVKDLGLGFVKLFVVRNKLLNNNVIDVYKRDDFTEIFSSFEADLIVLEELSYYNLPEDEVELYRKKMREFSAEICLKLFSDKKVIGLLFLGRKVGGRVFTKIEIDSILSIKDVLQVVLMNILLKQNLQEENDMMKEIIEEKTKKLKQQFKEIKDLLRQQSDFLAVTAHEFRTPLSIALFQLEDTIDTYASHKDLVGDMRTIGTSLNNLKDLTQKLFDVQQYDLDKVVLNLQLLKFSGFIEKIVKDFSLFTISDRMSDKKFYYESSISQDLVLDLDEGRVRQVLNNVLSNALKFADQIWVSVINDEEFVYVSIEDNGVGVLDVDKKRIFEKFQTTKTSMVLGIGLGLYLCKKIMKLHEGDIWVEDSEKGGAKFVIKFPR